MSQIPEQDYIDKILMLENSSHRFRKYELIEPQNLSENLDIIEIQNITKRLSQHIGFDKLIFTISLKDFDKKEGKIEEVFSNTAGNILLDNCEDVLIHLSRSLEGYPECVLATLSHEISHKYNHFNKLYFQNSYENEIFTDLTSVYLGYGKLMLNGVEVIKKYGEAYSEKIHTKKVGYLNREQLAFIYVVINNLLGIKNKEYYLNLKDDAIVVVKKIEKKYQPLIQNIKYYKHRIQEINNIRYKLAHLMKVSQEINEQKTIELNTYLRDEFIQLNLLENQTNKYKKDFINKTLIEPRKFRKFRKDFPKILFDSKKYRYYLQLNKKEKNIPSENNENLLINCLVCNTNIKLKTRNIGIIKCPKCNFKFAVDTRQKENFLMNIYNNIHKSPNR